MEPNPFTLRLAILGIAYAITGIIGTARIALAAAVTERH